MRRRPVGGDDDGGALVEPADQVEQQLAAGVGEWQVTQFVEHGEVEPRQVIGEPPLPAGARFALQPIDEVDDGVEAAARAASDAGPSDRYSEMAFAGAADQHGVALLALLKSTIAADPGRGIQLAIFDSSNQGIRLASSASCCALASLPGAAIPMIRAATTLRPSR